MDFRAGRLTILSSLVFLFGCTGTRTSVSVPEWPEAVNIVRLSDGTRVIARVMFSFTPQVLIIGQGPVADIFIDDYEDCFNRFKLLVQRPVQINHDETQEIATCGDHSSEWLELARESTTPGDHELKLGFPGALVDGKRMPFQTSVTLNVEQTGDFIAALNAVEMHIKANFKKAAAGSASPHD